MAVTGSPSHEGNDTIFKCRALGLELSYGAARRAILEDISLDVRDGEFFTIVGGSGAGKTTLLRILGGLTAATTGSAMYQNAPIAGPPEGVVVVFQDYSHALLQWRTVKHNIALGLEGRLAGDELQRRIDEALQLVGLEVNGHDYPWQLSGGMQQRVQIARALALHPRVMLMDEPFGALDAMTKAALQDEVLRLHARTGTTFVFITHDIEEAIYLGDRTAVLAGPPGRIHSIFTIDLPRPRDQIETRQLPEFLHYRSQLHSAIIKAAKSKR
jgi:NitT/TauT family transport system ATP-binding protein